MLASNCCLFLFGSPCNTEVSYSKMYIIEVRILQYIFWCTINDKKGNLTGESTKNTIILAKSNLQIQWNEVNNRIIKLTLVKISPWSNPSYMWSKVEMDITPYLSPTTPDILSINWTQKYLYIHHVTPILGCPIYA